jgi:hypothetical protein
MSWASYFHYYAQGIFFVYVIPVYQLHVCINLTCSLTDFSDGYTCVSYYSCEEPYLVVFPFLQTFSVHVGLFSTMLNSWTHITLFTLVLLRSLGGLIFIAVGFYYFVLPFVSLWQKGGVIFIFGPEIHFQTGQVIFVPEWPKEEFVRLWLATFCLDKITCM